MLSGNGDQTKRKEKERKTYVQKISGDNKVHIIIIIIIIDIMFLPGV